MKKSLWAFWKFREQEPASRRRIHLGIDYGTSTSKIVFRDYGAPGGELAIVVLRDRSFRIPSRICGTATELLFGDDKKAIDECDIYESLKMQVASETTNNPRFYFGPHKPLPSGFSAADLAALTVWFLISEGHRAVAAYFKGRLEGVSIGMTMGLPMAFFTDQQLRTVFLTIARRAWLFYRQEGLLNQSLLLDKAHRLLQKYPTSAISPTPEYEVRDWIRSEGEAAMWWAFQSPAVAAGPYAKVDIGAGTTHSSLYRIFGNIYAPKTGIAFLGAATIPVGMDAVDRCIAESEGLGGDCLALRGLEQSILESNAKARGALLPVCDQIYEAYRKAWIQTYHKINKYTAELQAWSEHKMFVIGGGSSVALLANAMKVHPGRGLPLQLATLEQPNDLIRADNTKVSNEELRFVTVAYGLSNIGLSIPEAHTPDEVPPMPDPNKRRRSLDREDIYAK